MMTKKWVCPHCGRDFIVARDAERDVCPWCKTPVQEKAGVLEQAPSPAPTGGTGSGSSGGSAGGSQGGGSSSQPSGEMWWPYEYDPF